MNIPNTSQTENQKSLVLKVPTVASLSPERKVAGCDVGTPKRALHCSWDNPQSEVGPARAANPQTDCSRSPADNNFEEFLDSLGISGDCGTPAKSRSKFKIHRDVEQQLMNLYEDKNLTIVSEEASRLQTELQFGQRRRDSQNPVADDSDIEIRDSLLKRVLQGAHAARPLKLLKRPQRRPRSRRMSQQLPAEQGIAIAHQLTRIRSSSDNQGMKRIASVTSHKSILSGSSRDGDNGHRIIDSPEREKNPSLCYPFPECSRKFIGSNNRALTHAQTVFSGSITEKRQEPRNRSSRSIKDASPDALGQLLPAPEGPRYKIAFLENVPSAKKIHKNEPFVDEVFFRLPCGLFYEGPLRYGKMHGAGALYVASFVADSGQPEFGSGAKSDHVFYRGEFKHGRVDGQGTLRFSNGDRFEGTFSAGVAHGHGKLVAGAGTGSELKGIWLEGMLHV